MSLEQKPTEQEWRNLYAATAEFKEMAPWNWMWDSDVAGVKDPESGEIGYCAIMGRLGEHFALAVYLGDAGLAGLWQMRLKPSDNPLVTLALQTCLMASFEDRAVLQKRDLDQIKRMGLNFRGRSAWPMFRSYRPGFQPWFLTGPEVRFLTTALQQSMNVAKRFQTNPDLLPEPNPVGPYLVRSQVKRKGSVVWQERRRRPGPLFTPGPPVGVLTADVDPKRLQQLKFILPVTEGALEMDFFLSPGAVKGEEDDCPYFPFVVLAADPGSGMILGMEMSKPGEVAEDMTELFLNLAEGAQMLPAKIAVVQPEAQVILQPVAERLGVEVVLVRRLKAIEAARRELAEFMNGRMF